MFKFLAILVVATAAVATAYNLSGDEFPLYRQRRDTKAVVTNGRCCEDGTIVPNYKEHLEVKKQCIRELKNENPGAENYDPSDPEQMAILKQLIVCEAECVFRAFYIIDNNGKLIREAVTDNFNPEGTKWKQVLVDRCWDLVQGNQQQGTVEGCSRLSFDITRCIWGGLILDCPSDYRVETPRCADVREQISQDDEAYFTNKFLKTFLNHTIV